MDLAKQVAQHEQRESRQADLDKRDTEHGGMRSIDVEVAEQVKREAMNGWRERYRPSATWREVQDAQAGIVRRDPRRVAIQRLWIDIGAAIRRWAPKYRLGKESGDTLRADALLLLLKWPQHGGGTGKDGRRKRPLDLGGEQGVPLRRDWLEPTNAARGPRDKLTGAAWEALHAAILQAAKSPAMRAMLPEQEIATDPVNIAELVEDEQRETAPAGSGARAVSDRLPDNMAPELVASYLDCPLDAARALVQRSNPAASLRELADAWKLGSVQAVKNALSRGAKQLRELYPDAADLLAAMDDAASRYRASLVPEVTLNLLDWRDELRPEIERVRAHVAAAPTPARRALAWIDAAPVTDAARWEQVAESVADWRDVLGSLSSERRALVVATFKAEQRAAREQRRQYDPARAESVADIVAPLMRAAELRTRERAASARSSHLPAAISGATTARLARFTRLSADGAEIDPRIAAAQRAAQLAAESVHRIEQWEALKASWRAS